VSFDYFLLLFLLDFRYVNSFTRRSFCVQFLSFSFYQLELCQDFLIHLTVHHTEIISNSTSRLTRTVNVMNMQSFAIIDVVLRFFRYVNV